MLIAIDHGNKNIKTRHRTFTAGLLASEYAAYGGETIKFAGQYYTLTDRRGGYRRDKTEDEDYYVLTLFALAYEIEACGAYEPDAYIEADLAVGVPPTDYGMLAERYKAYFAKNEYVDFEKNGKPYHVWIRSVSVYVQGWAALMPRFAAVKDEGKATLIDIGGYTAIYMVLHNGQPDFAACEALDPGRADDRQRAAGRPFRPAVGDCGHGGERNSAVCGGSAESSARKRRRPQNGPDLLCGRRRDSAAKVYRSAWRQDFPAILYRRHQRERTGVRVPVSN